MHTFLRSVNVADTLLSPSSFESAWAEWLSVDIHRHFSFDYLSNTGQGPWYAFNDNSLFKAMDIGTRFLGPKAVLQKRLGPRSVLEWMSFTATGRLSGRSTASKTAPNPPRPTSRTS